MIFKDLLEEYKILNSCIDVQLAKDFDVDVSTVSRWLSGKSAPRKQKAKEVLKAIGKENLFDKISFETVSDPSAGYSKSRQLNRSPPGENMAPISDVVGYGSSKDVEIWSDDNGRVTGYIDIGQTMPRTEVVIRVSGNSMTPNYPSGCLIGLRVISDGLFDYGSVYVIETPDNRFLKRIYKGKNDAHIQCYSDNNQLFTDGVRKGQPWYEPFQLPLSKIKRVFKVVGCIKHNDHSHIPEF